MEKPKTLQKFGYHLHLSKNFYSRCKPSELETEITCNLKYDKFVGKIIKVLNIEKDLFDYVVTFIEEESKRKIYVKPYKGQVDGIALLDDLNKAKEKWLGKTIYSKIRSISTYDENLDKFGSVPARIKNRGPIESS